MPNTSPTVDNAAVLAALIEQAQDEATVPTGFMAAISRGLAGEELTEMGELAGAGAAAFTDDGQPIRSAALMRRALQYAGSTGRRLALHCEEQSLSHGGQMHEGAVSAELGLAGYPAVAESVAVGRDLALAAYEDQPLHLMHLSKHESVELLRRALVDGVQVSAEVTPHHLCLTDEAVRSLDSNLKMNPPLGSERDRLALIEALKSGAISCIARRTFPSKRRRLESRASRRPSRRFTRTWSSPACYRSRRCWIECRPAPLTPSTYRFLASRWVSPPTSCCSISKRVGWFASRASARSRPTPGCSVRRFEER
jgi:dihydroorotase